MKPKRVVYSRLISKRNYENVKIEVEVEVEEGEKIGEVFEKVKKWVNKRIIVERLDEEKIRQAQRVLENKRDYTLGQIEEAEKILEMLRAEDDLDF